MKCPRCGSEMKDGMLFCEHCGEEIRIVQDFEPEIGGIVTGFEDASNLRQEKVNTQIREGPGKDPASPGQDAVSPQQDSGHAVSGEPLWEKESFAGKGRMAGMAAGLGALLLICLLAAAGTLFRNADYQYRRAMRYIEAGNFDTALPYAVRAVRLSPDDVDYLSAYASCLVRTGPKEETVSVCGRILALDASNELAYRTLAAIYEEEGDYEKLNELLLSCRTSRSSAAIRLMWQNRRNFPMKAAFMTRRFPCGLEPTPAEPFIIRWTEASRTRTVWSMPRPSIWNREPIRSVRYL